MIFRHIILLLLSTLFCTAILIAGQTPILNSDLPGGSGDWEKHENNLIAECEITTGEYKGVYRSDNPDLRLPAGYKCLHTLSGCANKDTRPANSCVNTRIRWLWQDGSTPWFDRDLPTGLADYESIELQLKLECFLGRQVYYPGDDLPAGYTCDALKGAWCDNSKTRPLNNCKYAPVSVRYSW